MLVTPFSPVSDTDENLAERWTLLSGEGIRAQSSDTTEDTDSDFDEDDFDDDFDDDFEEEEDFEDDLPDELDEDDLKSV